MAEDGGEASRRDSCSFESDPSWMDIFKDFFTELRMKYPDSPILWGYILIAIFGPITLGTYTAETGRWIQVTATILAFHDYLTYQVSLTMTAVSDTSRNFSRINTRLVSVPLIVFTNLVFAYPMLAYGSYSDAYVELMVLILALIGIYWFIMFSSYFLFYWIGKRIPSNPKELREMSDVIPDYHSYILSLDQEPSLRRVVVVGFLLLFMSAFIYHFSFFTVYLVVLFLLSIHPHTLELIWIIVALGIISHFSPLSSSYAILIQYLGRFFSILFISYTIYFSIHLRLSYNGDFLLR